MLKLFTAFHKFVLQIFHILDSSNVSSSDAHHKTRLPGNVNGDNATPSNGNELWLTENEGSNSMKNKFEIRKQFDNERRRFEEKRQRKIEQRMETPTSTLSAPESMDDNKKYVSRNIITPIDW